MLLRIFEAVFNLAEKLELSNFKGVSMVLKRNFFFKIQVIEFIGLIYFNGGSCLIYL